MSKTSLIDWKPTDPDVGSPPSVAELLGESTCAPDILARARELEKSTWELDKVAAVGTILRLWRPVGRLDLHTVIAKRSAPPWTAARDWAQTLSVAQIQTVFRLIYIEIECLQDLIDQSAGVLTYTDGDVPFAYTLADRRDMLESVLSILFQVQGGPLPFRQWLPVCGLIAQLDTCAEGAWAILTREKVLAWDKSVTCGYFSKAAIASPFAEWASWAVHDVSIHEEKDTIGPIVARLVKAHREARGSNNAKRKQTDILFEVQELGLYNDFMQALTEQIHEE